MTMTTNPTQEPPTDENAGTDLLKQTAWDAPKRGVAGCHCGLPWAAHPPILRLRHQPTRDAWLAQGATPLPACGGELYRDQHGFYCPRHGHRYPYQPEGQGRCRMPAATADDWDLPAAFANLTDARMADAARLPGEAAKATPAGRLRPTSALAWLPHIATKLPTRVPRTRIIPYDHQAAVRTLESEDATYEPPWAHIMEAVEAMGGIAFLRTDEGSAKHQGPKAYRITDEESMQRAFWMLVEDQEMKLWLEGGPNVLLVREWLDLPGAFGSFRAFGEREDPETPRHAVAREYRVFATAGRAICAHPYWPERAFEPLDKGGELPSDWRERLRALYAEPMPDELLSLARDAARACADVHEAWSVDFARDRNGDHWLIDMAPMEASWHPEDCPNAPRSEGKE